MRVLGYSLNIHYTEHIRQRVAAARVARLSPREGDAHSSDYEFFCPPSLCRFWRKRNKFNNTRSCACVIERTCF